MKKTYNAPATELYNFAAQDVMQTFLGVVTASGSSFDDPNQIG